MGFNHGCFKNYFIHWNQSIIHGNEQQNDWSSESTLNKAFNEKTVTAVRVFLVFHASKYPKPESTNLVFKPYEAFTT